MNDKFSEYKKKLEELVQKVNEASREKAYQKVVLLKDEIEHLESELEVKIKDLQSNHKKKQQQLDELIQKISEASGEKDFEKAAQLTEDAANSEEQIAKLQSEISESKEQIAQMQPKLDELKEHIARLRPQFLEAEINFEIGRSNFVRAVMLAEQHQYPQEKVRYLQELALRQYAFEFHNTPGLQKLIQWYGFSKAEVEEILNKGS